MDLVTFLTPVLAADLTPDLLKGLAAIGAGLVAMGGSRGIGAIGANAVEAIARQPEAKGPIQTAMIISAALIEGFVFFALIICMLAIPG